MLMRMRKSKKNGFDRHELTHRTSGQGTVAEPLLKLAVMVACPTALAATEKSANSAPAEGDEGRQGTMK